MNKKNEYKTVQNSLKKRKDFSEYSNKSSFNFERDKKQNNEGEKNKVTEQVMEESFRDKLKNKLQSKRIFPHKIEINLNKTNVTSQSNIFEEKSVLINKNENSKINYENKNKRKFFSARDSNENMLENNNYETPVKKGGSNIFYRTLEEKNKDKDNITKNRIKIKYNNLIKYKLIISFNKNN